MQAPSGKYLFYSLVWTMIILLGSCGRRNLIPEKDFVSILTGMYLSKSYFSDEGIHNARWNDTVPYNKHIVEQHGYEWAQFDSTVSWYCTRPKEYLSVYEKVMAQLNELEQAVSEELDPPEELWKGKLDRRLPMDGVNDTVPVNILLKGIGSYIISAQIKIYPQDESVNPHIELYLWRNDTTALGVYDTLWIKPLKKDGLMYHYRLERTLFPGNEFTHIKGNWLQHDRNSMDTAMMKHAEIKDISIYHVPKHFD
jgi:hypothetical protein